MKRVLDVACGGKMFYFDKSDSRVLFCDNRTVDTELCDGRKFSVHPDVECDFTSLPFGDGVFKLVVYDPPHLVRSADKAKDEIEPTGYQQIKYGALYSDWRDMLRRGFSECFRVLEDGGILIFKWSEIDISVKTILELTPQKPLFGTRCGKRSKTHWICFIKEDDKYDNA